MAELQYKQLNPELPEGAKTYCKQWIKETLYKRREQVKSKYILKGHDTRKKVHHDGRSPQARIRSRKTRNSGQDDFIMGTCDLDHEASDTVFDNKSSWSLTSSRCSRLKYRSKDYEAQIKGTCILWKGNAGRLCIHP